MWIRRLPVLFTAGVLTVATVAPGAAAAGAPGADPRTEGMATSAVGTPATVVAPSGVFEGISFGGGPEGNATRISAAGSAKVRSGPVQSSPVRSCLRLAAWEFNGDAWRYEYLTAAGLQQQPVATTTYGGAFTAFGVSLSTYRPYATRVTVAS